MTHKLLSLFLLVGALSFVSAAELEDGFRNPPDSAKVWTYWFWIDGNVTREGITTDLEAMARVGIKGVLIMDCSSKFASVPKGPVEFLSPEWREMFKHTLNEANRLGLQVSMNNDAGWTGSGGPWNTPERSMQMIVSSEIKIEGGRRFEEALPQPRTVGGFYRDIVVLALRQPKSTSPSPSPSRLTASSSSPGYTTANLQDGQSRTRWISIGNKPGMGPSSQKPEYLQFEYETAWLAAGLHLLPFPDCGPREIDIQCSDNGTQFNNPSSSNPGAKT